MHVAYSLGLKFNCKSSHWPKSIRMWAPIYSYRMSHPSWPTHAINLLTDFVAGARIVHSSMDKACAPSVVLRGVCC
jgi:hypothetical protein